MPRYRFVGWQDPGQHRPGRITDGAKTLEFEGDPVALSDAQYERISRFARLEPVLSEEEQQQVEGDEQPAPAQSGRPLKAADTKSDSKEG